MSVILQKRDARVHVAGARAAMNMHASARAAVHVSTCSTGSPLRDGRCKMFRLPLGQAEGDGRRVSERQRRRTKKTRAAWRHRLREAG